MAPFSYGVITFQVSVKIYAVSIKGAIGYSFLALLLNIQNMVHIRVKITKYVNVS